MNPKPYQPGGTVYGTLLNFRREHALNMWFVLATEAATGIEGTARSIEAATGLPVYLFPKEREFFVEMRLRA